jgi:hypothetical protein
MGHGMNDNSMAIVKSHAGSHSALRLVYHETVSLGLRKGRGHHNQSSKAEEDVSGQDANDRVFGDILEHQMSEEESNGRSSRVRKMRRTI